MSNFIIKQNSNRQTPSQPQFASEPRTDGLSYVKHFVQLQAKLQLLHPWTGYLS